jgi:hypothetical protein
VGQLGLEGEQLESVQQRPGHRGGSAVLGLLGDTAIQRDAERRNRLMDLLLYYVIIALFTGAISARIAENKGRSVVGWFLLGLMFNLFAVLLAAVSPPIEEAGRTQRCPECAEIVKWEAAKCRYCGTQLTRLT